MHFTRFVIFFSIFVTLQCNFQKLVAQDSTFHYLLNSYDVKFYYLDLQVNNSSIDLTGKAVILVELIDLEIDSLALELRQEVTLDSIWIDGNLTTFIHSDDFIRFELPLNYGKNDLVQLSVFYKLQGIDTDERIGIFNRETYPGKSVTYTLSEPYFSSSWFPCKQVLTDKADSVYVFLSVDDSLMAGSNGILSNISLLENGKKRYEWKSNYPIAYYLISLSVANYMDYSFMASVANGDSVLVQNFLYNDSAYFQENKSDIDATADMMELFSEEFGTYPFHLEKYGHCISPVGGGMEHQTMTTLGNFSFILVAHELAHQWFGNYVTCANWQNIWINEGFASYGEYLAIEELKNENEQIVWLKETHSLAISSPEGSVYVPEAETDNVSRIFDYGLTYRKGASIIHMIRHELGNDDLFFDILGNFLNTYANSVATAEDFRNVVEQHSNRSFLNFFQQWFYGSGHPILAIAWEQRNDSLIIHVEQTVSNPDNTSFFNLLIDFKIEYLGGDTLIQVRQEFSHQSFKIPMHDRIYRVIPDPDEWLLREISGINRILPDSSVLFHLFPNPSSDMIYIENYNIGVPYNVKIYNLEGKLLKDIDEKDVIATINVSDLVAGIYKIVVTTGDHKEVFQLSKL